MSEARFGSRADRLWSDVTFVNSFVSAAGRADLSEVLAVAAPPRELPGPLVQSSAHFVLDVSQPGSPAHMSATVGPNAMTAEEVSLTLVTRVALQGEQIGQEEMLRALDYAHDVGVRVTGLTNETMHKTWGRLT